MCLSKVIGTIKEDLPSRDYVLESFLNVKGRKREALSNFSRVLTESFRDSIDVL